MQNPESISLFSRVPELFDSVNERIKNPFFFSLLIVSFGEFWPFVYALFTVTPSDGVLETIESIKSTLPKVDLLWYGKLLLESLLLFVSYTILVFLSRYVTYWNQSVRAKQRDRTRSGNTIEIESFRMAVKSYEASLGIYNEMGKVYNQATEDRNSALEELSRKDEELKNAHDDLRNIRSKLNELSKAHDRESSYSREQKQENDRLKSEIDSLKAELEKVPSLDSIAILDSLSQTQYNVLESLYGYENNSMPLSSFQTLSTIEGLHAMNLIEFKFPDGQVIPSENKALELAKVHGSNVRISATDKLKELWRTIGVITMRSRGNFMEGMRTRG